MAHSITRLGFSVTAVILAGQTLASINPGTLPLVVGIIIVAICSLVPCFVGYNLVHKYERYAWMVTSIVMLFLWGLGGKAGFDMDAQKPLEDTGKALSADVLSFGGIVFGSFTGVRTPPFLSYVHVLTMLSVGPGRGGLQLSPSSDDLSLACFHPHFLRVVAPDLLR